MVRTHRHRGYTMIEIAVTLFLISVLTVASALMFGGSSLQGTDAAAQATADAAIDAAVAVFQAEGDTDAATTDRLAVEEPDITFYDPTTPSLSSSQASMRVANGVAAAAVTSSDGACWMFRRAINPVVDERLRLYALAPAGSNAICTGQQAYALSADNIPPGRGDAWNKPYVKTDGTDSGSVTAGATLLLRASSATTTGQTLRNEGTGGNALDATFGSSNSADSTDPTLLEYNGEPYLHVPATNGNTISALAPDAAAATRDVDIRARISPANWASTAQVEEIVHQTAPNNASTFAVQLTNSHLELVRTDATSLTPSTIASTASTATWKGPRWIRVTYDATAHTAKFYTSSDSPTQPASWTALDTVTPASGSTSVIGAGYPITVGSGSGTTNGTLDIYSVEVRSAINGPVVAGFDPTACDITGTQCTGLTAETWSINRPTTGPVASIVTRPVLSFYNSLLTIPASTLLNASGTQSVTVVATYRTYGSPANSAIAAKQAPTGWSIRFGNTTNHVVASYENGSGPFSATKTGPTLGQYTTAAARFDTTTGTITAFDATGPQTQTAPAGVWNSSAGPTLIGASGAFVAAASNMATFELVTIAVFNTALDDTSVARAMNEIRATG